MVNFQQWVDTDDTEEIRASTFVIFFFNFRGKVYKLKINFSAKEMVVRIENEDLVTGLNKKLKRIVRE